MLQNLLYVGAALLLVLLNGFFVAAEFALVKLRQTQAATMAASHGWRGRILVSVHGHLDAYLSACQLGITLASLALGWVGEPAFAHLLEPVFSRLGIGAETTAVAALVIAFTLISYLHIVLGELAPKSLAIRRPEAMSLWTAAPLYAFYWLMYPAIRLLNASANWMLSKAGLEAGTHGDEQHYSREELKLIVHAKHASRSNAADEYTMMKYALDLPELVVGDLLRTRDQLASLRDGMSTEQVLAEFRRTRYSRYPWFDAGGDQVRGVLHMKDLLHAIAEHAPIDDVVPLLRPPILLPLHTPVLDVLQRFRAGQTHLALGAEESGRVAGFFTLEDILEVLVGDIEDEPSRRSGLAERNADGSFTISGGTPIYKLERLLERDIDAPADVNSVGGLIIHRLERLPVEGETLAFDGFDLAVRTMQGARAKTILVLPNDAAGSHATQGKP